MTMQRDIVLLSFPFSDLKTEKVRPTIVISNNSYNQKFEDIIVVPMTTNLKLREYAVLITNKELESGRLITDSMVKVDRVFSVSKKIVRMKIGKVKLEVHEKIKTILLELIK